jgi:hypothetical protein
MGVLAERPDLVRAAGNLSAEAGPRNAVAVEPEQRAEGTELEQADDQLAEIRVGRVAAVEAADVGRPPGNPGEADVQAGTDLLTQRA